MNIIWLLIAMSGPEQPITVIARFDDRIECEQTAEAARKAVLRKRSLSLIQTFCIPSSGAK